MREGVDVVYQGVFAHDGWRGVADFLLRQPDGTYEVLDTKLARTAKPAYILQLLFYNEQLARVQGREPEHIHVLLGNGDQQSFRPQEFAAYYRRVRSRLEALRRRAAGRPSRTPSTTAAVCDFKPLCDAYWDSVDHLSRVAGLYPDADRQARRRGDHDARATGTRAGRARAGRDSPPTPGRSCASRPSCSSTRARPARTPSASSSRSPRAASRSCPTPRRATSSSTSRATRSGTRTGALEYLWGILDVERNFTPLHAHDHETERLAFETFVDLVHARLLEHPKMHVYHYAPYEITALKRLMGRYGTREAELDDLLRRGVFVDLYKVVRNGIRASRPGYGLKELEHFLDFEREAEVKDGGASIVIFEQWMQTGEQALLDQIDAYNREDCIATLLLRDWLLERRAEALAQFGPFPLPEPKVPKPTPEVKVERAALREQLLDAGEELAAQLLDYHDRERKPVWWAYFDRIEMTPTELVEDSESIGRLELVRRAGAGEEVAGLRARLPRAGAQARAGTGRGRPGDARGRGRDPRARPRGAPADAQARAVARGRAAARGAHPRLAVLDEGSGGRARAARPLAARAATGATRRSSPCSAASRSTGRSRPPSSTR